MTMASAGHRMLTVGAQSGLAVRVAAGAVVSVIDVKGQQVGDMWMIDAADPGRWLSASHTRDRCERLFPRPAEQFCDQHGIPILDLVADTSPGVHDMLSRRATGGCMNAAVCPVIPTAGTISWRHWHRWTCRCRWLPIR
jgi:uncharacterized protein YcgI (DUF1989 family)